MPTGVRWQIKKAVSKPSGNHHLEEVGNYQGWRDGGSIIVETDGRGNIFEARKNEAE